MAYTTIDNPELYFQTKLWTGDDSTDNAITFDAAVGAISLTQTSGFYLFGHSSDNSTTVANYGNPITANSSDAADANGYGAFEFAPPSGYYALNTKNLAEFG